MKFPVRIALVAVSLLLSAGLALAADGTAPGTGAKGDANVSAAPLKQNVKGKGADAKATAKSALVDINSAADSELKAVSGIGDAYAAKIIAGRPYANKAQLKSRHILPRNVYEQVKDRIIARLVKQ